jgi:hypothetical protein
MELQQIEHLNPHSIELSKNAKGEYAWVVKAYFGDEDPIGRIKAIDAELRRLYLPQAGENSPPW